MTRSTPSNLWRVVFALGLAVLFGSAVLGAEEQVDEMTIYGTNRSEISASPLTDTRAIESTTQIETPEIEDGLKAEKSQVEREVSPVEKPKIDESNREKLDVTPDVEYRVDWKLALLIGLLETAGIPAGK